ncbi:MAG: SDR family NAD(P)-dependent oxidoreductase [Pseudomonadota bacterium]
MHFSTACAIVTGGASGLGEATVRAIAEAGGRVVIFDRDADRANALVDALGAAASFEQVDVTSEESVARAISAACDRLGRIDVCVNCAGIAIAVKTTGKDGAHPLDAYRQTIDVNLVGTYNVARLAAVEMEKNEPDDDGCRGVIINTASVAAFDGQKGQAAYAASKGGVASSSLPMARDLAFSGIRVNAIAPGLFLTPMFETALSEEAQAALGQQVTFPKRLGRPAEFARMVQAMVENPYMNGATIRLDGGIRLP